MSQHVVDHPDVLETSNESFMKTVSLEDSEAKQEMIDGQPVIVAVRWILIVSSLFLALWNVGSLGDLRLQIVAILLLAITNFYLQAQLLMKKPVNKNIIYGASVVDLLLITMLVIFQGGYYSSIYVFYLPAIAAYAVAFPSLYTMLLTASAILLYGLVSLFTNDSEGSVIITRLIMIAAVAYCGNLYLRIERSRRVESNRNQEDLLNNLSANSFAVQMAAQQELETK